MIFTAPTLDKTLYIDFVKPQHEEMFGLRKILYV